MAEIPRRVRFSGCWRETLSSDLIATIG